MVALHLYQGMSFPKVAELLSSTALSVRETLESVGAREAIASRFNRSEEALIRHVPKTKKANKNGK